MGFVYDDVALIAENEALGQPGTLAEALASDLFHFASSRASPYWRPVITASYYLEHALGGGQPWAFHLGNLVALWGASLALFALLSRHAGLLAAAVGAALLVVHPLVVEPAVNVASRTDVVCLVFALLALLARRGPAALLLALLACGSKELAVALPLVAWVLDRSHPRWRWMLGASVLYLAGRAWVLAGHAAPEEGLDLAFLLGVPWRMTWMSLRLLLPAPLPPAMTVPAPGAPMALVGLLAAGLAGMGLRRADPLQRAGVALLVCALLPVSGLLGAWPRYGDGLLVVPLAGMTLVLAPLLQRRRVVAWSLAPLLIGLAGIANHQVSRWSSEAALWGWALELRPDDPQLRLNLARSLDSEATVLELTQDLVHPVPRVQREVHALRAHALLASQPEAARAEALRACVDDPEAAWACSVACVFGPEAAVCGLATHLAPEDPNLWNALGIAVGGVDRVAAFERACDLSPEEGPFCANAERARSELQAVPGGEGGG